MRVRKERNLTQNDSCNKFDALFCWMEAETWENVPKMRNHSAIASILRGEWECDQDRGLVFFLLADLMQEGKALFECQFHEVTQFYWRSYFPQR